MKRLSGALLDLARLEEPDDPASAGVTSALDDVCRSVVKRWGKNAAGCTPNIGARTQLDHDAGIKLYQSGW